MAKFPAWSVFKRVDAATLDSMLPNNVTKVAATTITSSTVMANDSELVNIALAIGTWEIEAKYYASGLAAATGGIKTGWTFSGTLSGTPLKDALGPGSGNVASAGSVTPTTVAVTNWNTVITYGLTNTALPYYLIREECTAFVVTVAGNFTVQFAQNTSSATSTVVQPGSRVRVRQVA